MMTKRDVFTGFSFWELLNAYFKYLSWSKFSTKLIQLNLQYEAATESFTAYMFSVYTLTVSQIFLYLIEIATGVRKPGEPSL